VPDMSRASCTKDEAGEKIGYEKFGEKT